MIAAKKEKIICKVTAQSKFSIQIQAYALALDQKFSVFKNQNSVRLTFT